MGISSTDPEVRELATEARRAMTDDDEPLKSHERTIQRDSTSDSPMANLSTDCRDIVGLSVGDRARLHVFEDMVVIVPDNDE